MEILIEQKTIGTITPFYRVSTDDGKIKKDFLVFTTARHFALGVCAAYEALTDEEVSIKQRTF